MQTPQGIDYSGKKSVVNQICGVSILRAGECMEAGLSEVCQDIRGAPFNVFLGSHLLDSQLCNNK